MVIRDESVAEMPACATTIWEAVMSNNLQEVYKLIWCQSITNIIFDDVFHVDSQHQVDVQESNFSCNTIEKNGGETCQWFCHKIIGSEKHFRHA